MLERCELLGGKLRTQSGILRLLQVDQEVLLGLSALVVAILLRVHGQFKQFFIVLSAIPSVVGHLLAERIKRIGYERVRVGIGKLTFLLGSQLTEQRVYLTRHGTALAKNHTPHRVVHHYKSALALCHSEQIHQRDVLDILRERRDKWRISYTRPYIFHFLKQFYQHVVHGQLGLALALQYSVDYVAYAAKVGHHRAHHTAWQSTTEQ